MNANIHDPADPVCVECFGEYPADCENSYDFDGESWSTWLWCIPCEFWTEFIDDRGEA